MVQWNRHLIDHHFRQNALYQLDERPRHLQRMADFLLLALYRRLHGHLLRSILVSISTTQENAMTFVTAFFYNFPPAAK